MADDGDIRDNQKSMSGLLNIWISGADDWEEDDKSKNRGGNRNKNSGNKYNKKGKKKGNDNNDGDYKRKGNNNDDDKRKGNNNDDDKRKDYNDDDGYKKDGYRKKRSYSKVSFPVRRFPNYRRFPIGKFDLFLLINENIFIS
jgi:hypothetical protein